MIAVFLSPLYVVLHIFLIWRLLIWLGNCHKIFKKKQVIIFILLIYAFFSCAILIGFLLPKGMLKYIISGIGNFWLGILLYSCLIFVINYYVKLAYYKIKNVPVNKEKTTKFYKISGFICVFLIAFISIYGAVNAKHINVTKYEVTINKKVSNFKNLNIVLIADLHIGYNLGSYQIAKMVDKINEQKADVVIIAGDIFDNDYDAIDNPTKIVNSLRQIKSKYGIYAVYGNHDIDEKTLAGFTFDYKSKKVSDLRMDKMLKDANINLLRDEYIMLNDEIYIYGRPDYKRLGRGISKRKTPQEITENMDKTKPIILIDHQPRELHELAQAKIDLDLSGHTHNGQVFPGTILTKLMWENPYGYKKINSFNSIVTSGVGLYGPNMRVGTIAEIVNIKVNFS